MGQDLTGQQINTTFDALLKTSDYAGLTTTRKTIGDGVGIDSCFRLATTSAEFTNTTYFNGNVIFGASITITGLNTDDVAEATNLYWTQNRFDTAFTAKDTDDLSEGTTNLYWTQNRFDTAFATAISPYSTDISNLESDVLTISGDVISNTTAIGNEETARITADGVLQGYIDDLEAGVGNVISVNTLTGGLTLSAGTNVNITDNGSNTITISSTGGGGGGAVDDVNGLTGSITISSTDLDYLTIAEVGNDIQLSVLEQRTITEDVKNTTAGTLTKGTPVHITGSTGNEAEVIPANATTGLAAHLVLDGDIAAGATGKAVAVGFINNVSVSDTTNFQPGTHVYLADGGGFTHIRPDGTSIVQYLGVVVKASTTSGAGTISGIIQNLGVENELPNLPQNYIWLGDANGVPQAVDFAPYTGSTGGISWNGSTANGIATYGSSTTADVETNLTFNGSTNTLRLLGDFEYNGSLYPQVPGSGLWTGEISPKVGSSLSIGKIYYMNSAGGWTIADNTAEASTAPMLGVAVSTTQLLIYGYVSNAGYAGYSTGTPIYLDSGGNITNTIPNTSTHFVRKLGFCYDGSTRVIHFNPSHEYYEIA